MGVMGAVAGGREGEGGEMSSSRVEDRAQKSPSSSDSSIVSSPKTFH